MSQLPVGKKILLYQGAVNVGRGIEWIMDVMAFLPECHFVVAGVGDEYPRLKAMSDTMANVTFLGRVEPTVLHALTKKADLGLALLENRGLNYYYSLPNRMADYIEAHLPVVATDFPEIHRVVSTYDIGLLVPAVPFDMDKGVSQKPDAAQLAQTINDALTLWQSIPLAEKEERFNRAAADFTWENDKKVLLKQIGTIKTKNQR